MSKIALPWCKIMCGRFTLSANAQRLQEFFPIFEIPETAPRFNIAPTQAILAVRQEEIAKPAVAFLRWGLIPSWAKDKKIGASLINARADTVASKPSFRAAFKRHRCLILADGFYEWRKGEKPKQPFHIRRGDGRPFAFAGLCQSLILPQLHEFRVLAEFRRREFKRAEGGFDEVEAGVRGGRVSVVAWSSRHSDGRIRWWNRENPVGRVQGKCSMDHGFDELRVPFAYSRPRYRDRTDDRPILNRWLHGIEPSRCPILIEILIHHGLLLPHQSLIIIIRPLLVFLAFLAAAHFCLGSRRGQYGLMFLELLALDLIDPQTLLRVEAHRHPA
jgi:hypothetical protein